MKTSAYNGGVLSASSTFTPLFSPSAAVHVSPDELRRHPGWFETARSRGRAEYDRVIPPLAVESIGLYRQFLSTEGARVDLIGKAVRLTRAEDAGLDAWRTGGKLVGDGELLEMGTKGVRWGRHRRDRLAPSGQAARPSPDEDLRDGREGALWVGSP